MGTSGLHARLSLPLGRAAAPAPLALRTPARTFAARAARLRQLRTAAAESSNGAVVSAPRACVVCAWGGLLIQHVWHMHAQPGALSIQRAPPDGLPPHQQGSRQPRQPPLHGAHAPQPYPPPTPARPAPAQALADSLDPLPAAPAAAPPAAAAAAAAPIASSDEEDRDWFAGRNADDEATEDESERMSFASLFGNDVDEEPEVVEESLKVGGNINTHLFVTSLSYWAEMGEICL